VQFYVEFVAIVLLKFLYK